SCASSCAGGKDASASSACSTATCPACPPGTSASTSTPAPRRPSRRRCCWPGRSPRAACCRPSARFPRRRSSASCAAAACGSFRGDVMRDVINPTDGSVLARVPEATPEDVARAVGLARAAFDEGPWPRLPARERGTLLLNIAEEIRPGPADFPKTDTRNRGKPIVEAEFDVADAAHCFEYYGGLASKNHGETLRGPRTPWCRGARR